LVDPASEQTPGESPDGTPEVPPADPLDVPNATDDTLTTIAYSQQWTGSQSQNDYDSFGDVITFGPSGVTTSARLGFGGGDYALDLVSSSTLAWTQTTGDAESANWSIAAYGEDSQFDLSSSGGYLSMTNLTIVDCGSDPLTAGVTGTYSADGRDHNDRGYMMWMAGGGVKGGFQYGASDDYGYEAVEGKIHTHDWHATILHLLGLDHEKLTYRYAGRDMRLTDVKGNVVKQIIA